MTWDVVVLMLMEIVETEVVVTEIVVREVALTELVVVQLEFALLSGIVPQCDCSGHSPLPAK